ncbi:hypothetical protein LTR56_015523 [Elasticomyces elasticus]|nr:hypothetical protein LTR56_015523 [Elasticomyces elasticus]KAK3662556.1 hypothetical protein LTR22_006622 [Elasticomyces elasticus]KAK4927899.1 hypothetical protein LTR49_005321 [Elasticomyces elasticus]KAK5756041.1 hypothetical protein LTS12_013831 [Elasticomyces elasticus]
MSDVALADLIWEKAGENIKNIVAWDILPLKPKGDGQRYTQKECRVAKMTASGPPLLDLQYWGNGMLLPLWTMMEHSNSSVPEKKAAIGNAVQVRKQTPNALYRHVAECIESDVENACVLDDIMWKSKRASTPKFLSDIDIPIKLHRGGVPYERLNQSSNGDDISDMFSSKHGGGSASTRKQVGQVAHGNGLGSKSKNAKKDFLDSEGRGETEKEGGQARSEHAAPQASARAADSTHHGGGPSDMRHGEEATDDDERVVTPADPNVDEALANDLEKTEPDLAMSTVDGDDDVEGEGDENDESKAEGEDGGSSSEQEVEDGEDDGAEVEDSEEDESEDDGSEGEDDGSEVVEEDDADDSEQDDTANDNSDRQSRIDDALKTTELGSIIAATAARNVVGGESGSDTAGNPGADEAAKVVNDNSISQQAGNVADPTVNANTHNAASNVANAGQVIDSDDDNQHGKTATTQGNVEDVEMDDDELADNPHGAMTANGGAIGGVRIVQDHQQKEDDDVAEIVGAGNAMGNVGDEQNHQQGEVAAVGKRRIMPLKGLGQRRNTAPPPPPDHLAPTIPAPQVQHYALGETITQSQQEAAAQPKTNNIERPTSINGVQDHATNTAAPDQNVSTEPASNHLEPLTPIDDVQHHAVSSIVFFQPQQKMVAETSSPISGDGQGIKQGHAATTLSHAGTTTAQPAAGLSKPVAPFRPKLPVHGKMRVKTQNLWWNRGLPMRVVRMCGRRMWVHENERLASSSDLFGEFVFGGPFTAYYDSEKGVIHSIMPDGKLGPVVGPAKFVGEGRWSDDFYGEKRKDFASPPEGSGRWRVFIR